MAESYKPTGGMVSEARKGLDWRKEHGRGGTEVGIARARDIVNGRSLPLDTVKRMYSFFSRHEVDKKAKGFRPGEEGYPSNGRIAWALWGGDAGYSWSRKIVNAERAYDDARPYPNEHAARLKDPSQFDEFRRKNDAGGAGIDFIYGIKAGESDLQSIRFDKNRYTVAEAKAWLSEHDYSPIKFEAAMERENESVETPEDDEVLTVDDIANIIDEVEEESEIVTDEREDRDMSVEVMHRSMGMESKVVDEETRRVRIAVSSEKPVERSFGNEILVHDAKAIDMEFLSSGRAPLLLDHDPEKQIGVIESVDLDSETRRLRAVARFGKGALAQEVFSDVVDGIRTNISVGYRVNKMEKAGSDSYRVSSWSPLEVSVVSIPADTSVGLGRSATASEPQAPEVEQPQETRQGEITMSENTVDIEAVKAEAAKNAAKSASEILSLGSRHNKRDLAERAIGEGRSVAEFRGMLLDAIGTDKPLEQTSEIGFTKEEKREYSLARAIRNMASGKFGGFEAEVSQELAARYGKDPRGFYVPMDIFKRDVTTASPANGSNLVATDHLGSEFIDALRANLVISGLGARMMSGLKGDVAIPALNAKTSVGFVAENNAPGAEGAPTFRQVSMSPKTMVQYIDISRKLMMQSDPSVDSVLRNDMIQQFAAKLDDVAIEGGGTNEPTGILGTNGIGSVALGTNGGAITYASLVNLEREVAIDNALNGSLAYLTNPKVVAAMRQTARQSSGVEGNFILNDTNTLLGYRVASSTLVPSDLTKGTASGVCSAVVFGNYADLMIGLWGGLDVLVDPYTGSSTGATRIAMYQDVDVAVRHVESFAAIKDVTTA